MDPIEMLLNRIRTDAERDGKATISTDEVQALIELNREHKELKNRFTEEHFQLLEKIERENQAIKIQKKNPGSTHERRERALQIMGVLQPKISPVDETFLLFYYANLRNGIDPFDSEKKREPLSEEDAIKHIAGQSGQSEQAVKKELRRAYKRLKDKKALPKGTQKKQLKNIIPFGWDSGDKHGPPEL